MNFFQQDLFICLLLNLILRFLVVGYSLLKQTSKHSLAKSYSTLNSLNLLYTFVCQKAQFIYSTIHQNKSIDNSSVVF